MKKIFFFAIFLFAFSFAFSQENQKNWSVTGYVKDLQSLFFIDQPPYYNEAFFQDNLIHNRINFKWYPNDKITFKAELRNRIFWGDQIRNPFVNFIEGLDKANDFFTLSYGKADAKGIAFHTMFDRLYFDYSKDSWEIRLGRQRINWGINTAWNPNDIFNAFSFIDFDYEERPGSDALRVKYYLNFASSIEFAVKAFDDKDKAVGAVLWKFNYRDYDFQLLSGIMQKDFVIGGGWAGNIKNAGFKGEFAWFHGLESDSLDNFTGTIGMDYVFSNSLYGNIGFLFNEKGSVDQNSTGLFAFELSAKSLYPYKTAVFVQLMYPFNPLINGGLAIIYSPVKVHPLFLNPLISYSIAENLDAGLFGQILFSKEGGDFKSPVQAVFLRLKYSY